ncbi:hypothetical protein DQ04_03501050 [Trypanosoma grayi]|uniref:hypothetical protein n=1 Tax=Trypanosoma grayi TaxID=71804 RepID=UPI0004F4611B|nr:hypothetical protein DQ04_03501050 [Trypanosoma grayi]KEG10621.1 hypothetical protein DQ04_03501050 [Trypanosoma grayi]
MSKDVEGCSSPLPLSRRVVFFTSPAHSLRSLAQALQECSERLHLGPYGLLAATVNVQGELQLWRQRAADVLQNTPELAAWRVLWHAFFNGAPVAAATAESDAYGRRRNQMFDGHGRLLVTGAALLRHLLSPEACYPITGTWSSPRNRLRLVRVLRELTTPGGLRSVPVEMDFGGVEEAEDDVIGRMTRVCLREVRPCSYCVGSTVTRRVLEGCIHVVMSTEVEGDVLATLRQILVRFLWGSEYPKRWAPTRSVAARARSLLTDPALCIVPCVGCSVLSSRALPCGTIALPTASERLSAHQGTATPLLVLDGGHATERRGWVLLLRIDNRGGLLDFEHSKGRHDAVGGGGGGTCDGWCMRNVQRPWTAPEQEEAQLEAARLLYEWAWAHDVAVIVTPSHAPPVIKTYGQRYRADNTKSTTPSSSDATKKNSPVFMVDEVDATVFDALLRRLQYWHHENLGDEENDGETPMCPTAAELRRGKLVLPERTEDALMPFRRLLHGPLYTVFPPATPSSIATAGTGGIGQLLLLELDQNKPSGAFRSCARGLEGAGSILLVSPTATQLRVYTTLILKCVASVLAAVDASPCGDATPERGMGFVRAGGAFPIALARQMRRSAEALTRTTRSGDDPAVASVVAGGSRVDVPVVAAVLRVLSEALLEVPRRLAAHVTAHHRPLKHAWLRLEGFEVCRDDSLPLRSLNPTRGPPLHVCIREDPTYYHPFRKPPLCEAAMGSDGARRYFCCSDTDSSSSSSSSGSGSDEEEVCFRQEAAKSLGLSFVEPIATTTSALRSSVRLLHLILTSEATTSEVVDMWEASSVRRASS